MTSFPPDFADFRALSSMLGQNALFVQGAGGNTSIKHDGAMWIKASGTWLKDAASKNIFVTIDHGEAVLSLDQAAEPQWRRLDHHAAMRPSIETSLHALLPQRVVAHFHAVSVVALAVRRDAAEQFNEVFRGLRFAFVPYVRPGMPLTRALGRALQSSASDIYVLGNHGLIIGGQDSADVINLLGSILKCLKSSVRPMPVPDIEKLEALAAQYGWRLPRDRSVHRLATDAVSCGYAVGGSLYPDHVVFLGRGCRIASQEELATINPSQQKMIIVRDQGVLIAPDLSPAGEATLECSSAVVARIPPGVALQYLSPRDEDDLLAWDAEEFRKSAP